ncbi:MAG UNVERIFIED_CONTAM: hypothetical protein LVR18_30240 [Planctomycetaceae bacterium]|jgi:hypothetical protein
MVGAVADHGADLAESIDVAGGVGEQFGDPVPGFAVSLPVPRPGHEFIAAVIENATDFIGVLFEGFGDGFAVELCEQRFVVEQIKATGTAVLKQEDHLFSAGGDVWWDGCEVRGPGGGGVAGGVPGEDGCGCG